jgi:WXXGXW repeat (2 copies)
MSNTLKDLLWKFALIATLAMLGAVASHAQVSIGIQIGAPPPPRVLAVMPPSPAPDFVWVEGYWYPAGKHYKWHEGYWTRPPYAGARWVAPHHDGERYFAGYWDGDRGHVEHDHHWDHDKDRDRDRWHDHDDHDRDHHEDHDDHR